MIPTLLLREQLLQRIIAWGEARPDLRALALVGSGARSTPPADEWSDIDLVLVTTTPGFYLESGRWAGEIEAPWIETVERDGAGKTVERRVLFRCGVDVDFIVVAADQPQAFEEEALVGICTRGMRVLLDKGYPLPRFEAQVHADQPPAWPNQAQFGELVDDFWFHAVWTAKKIKRGELWSAKSCCDVYMKRHLLAMIEYHARSRGVQQTWYGGRFVERWAPVEVVAALGGVFAHYDAPDVWRALLATMNLFDQLAREVAERWGYGLPEETVGEIRDWVTRVSTG